MKKKIVKLKESDLMNIVRKVIKEDKSNRPMGVDNDPVNVGKGEEGTLCWCRDFCLPNTCPGTMVEGISDCRCCNKLPPCPVDKYKEDGIRQDSHQLRWVIW